MLYIPVSDYKFSASQSIAAQKSKQPRCASSERNNVLECNEARRASSSSRGTASSSLQRSLSFRPPSLSRIASAAGSKKLVTPEQESVVRPFISKYGRRYLRDVTLPYPLPSDLAETHRQTLRTMMLCQVFNGPLCSPLVIKNPPTNILEVACGDGYWSKMCHLHFSRLGQTSISFTGIDIAPLAQHDDNFKKNSMNWRFVQHDLRQVPLPFQDEEFCLVMVKDLSMVIPTTGIQQSIMDEYIRILKPGGTIEIWDGDHSIRMLLPPAQPDTENPNNNFNSNKNNDNNNNKVPPGAYVLTQQMSLAPSKNEFLNNYNTWIAKVLGTRNLSTVPCTAILSMLLQESETLQDIDFRRLVIPLGEIDWEKEVFNKSIDNPKGKQNASENSVLDESQKALRRTALNTVIQMIESLDPLLREASGMREDHWDCWMDSISNNLLRGNGTSSGECLEVGAWWAKKKAKTPS